MGAWLRCVFLKGGHLYGRWWWAERTDGAGTHRMCDECGHMGTLANLHSWTSHGRAWINYSESHR